jgi:hypothetical protein
MTSQATNCSITMAIMGLISIMPSLGTIRRNGARIGSVISVRKRIGWSYGFGANQDRMARAAMAKLNTWQKILIKVRMVSILSIVQPAGFLIAFNDSLGQQGSQSTFLQAKQPFGGDSTGRSNHVTQLGRVLA